MPASFKRLRTRHSQTAVRPSLHAGPDLHGHTTHSEGVSCHGEVLGAAAVVGLPGLAIADHDTVSGLALARHEAARLGLELIAGLELTCAWSDREFHLLGYYFQEDDANLCEAMSG